MTASSAPEPDEGSAASSPEPSDKSVEYGPSGWEPVITRPDPMSAEELEAWLDHLAGEDEALDPEEYPDPDGPPPPGEDELTAAEAADVAEAVQAEAQGAVNGARSGTSGGRPRRRGLSYRGRRLVRCGTARSR